MIALRALILLAAAGPAWAAEPAPALPAKVTPVAKPKTGITGLDQAIRRPDGAQVITGTLGGNGVIRDQGTRIIQGKVAPGNSPGCVTDQGNVTFEGSAWLEIELGGTTVCTGYDQYTVNLSLTLNSPTLKVLLIDGFVPAAGQRFDILNWGTLTGTFGKLELPALPVDLAWDTSKLYTTGELAVVTTGDVPLPAWALAVLGGGLLWPALRRRSATRADY